MEDVVGTLIAASIGELISAVFNGAPTPEAAETYSAQLTALISLYICGIAIFVLGLYVRAIDRRDNETVERKTFKRWIALSLIFSILVIAAYLILFFNAAV
jgi:H+/Cl- antiporter ClcA